MAGVAGVLRPGVTGGIGGGWVSGMPRSFSSSITGGGGSELFVDKESLSVSILEAIPSWDTTRSVLTEARLVVVA